MEPEVAKKLATDLGVSTQDFMGLADKVIGFANHSAQDLKKDAVHMAFLYAIARYGAYVWRSTNPAADNPEEHVSRMLKEYEAMLREQVADPTLMPPKSS